MLLWVDTSLMSPSLSIRSSDLTLTTNIVIIELKIEEGKTVCYFKRENIIYQK